MQELADLRNVRSRLQTLIVGNLARLEQQLALTKNRPALASPATLIDQRLKDNSGIRNAIFMQIANRLKLESAQLTGVATTLRALSPQGTLERGFSIVRNAAGEILRSTISVSKDDEINIRFADGDRGAKIT